MRRASIKAKIAAWFAGIVLVVALLSMAVMYIGTLRVTESSTKSALIADASAAAQDISLADAPAAAQDISLADAPADQGGSSADASAEQGGSSAGTQVVISDKINEITASQVIILGKNGVIYYGQAARELISLKMTDGSFQRVTVNGSHFFVYDRLLRFGGSNENAVWIRTYATLTTAQLFGNSMLIYWIIMIPVLASAAVGLSLLFTKRAFRPIEKINAAAAEITENGDFSRRIPYDKESSDEFSRMSGSFNRMLDRLEGSYENEKQFTSDASHELRTPLSVIMAQAEILTEQLPEEDARRKSADTILRQSRQMSRLVSELLMISRMENHNLKLCEEDIDVRELMELVCEEMAEQAQEKNIRITADCRPGIIFRGDQTMLMRIYVNLIGNAIRYGKKDGHVKISVEKEIKSDAGKTDSRTTHDQTNIHLQPGSVTDRSENTSAAFITRIEDDGIGIAKENLDKIWNRFYQADPSKSSGSGLGLFMVKWIAEYYHGEVCAESTEGKGSVFTVVLPVKAD